MRLPWLLAVVIIVTITRAQKQTKKGSQQQACRDERDIAFCNKVRTRGKCHARGLVKKCRLTCDACAQNCEDKAAFQFCRNVRRKGKCDKGNFAQKCPKTCNVCGLPGPPSGEVRHHCEVSGDPHLEEFDGERASVPLPCVYRVANLLVNASATSRYPAVRVVVDASGGMSTHMGRYFVEYVRVRVSLLTRRDDGTLVTDKTALYETDDQFVKGARRDSAHSAWNMDADSADYFEMAAAVEYGYDPSENLAYLYLWEASPAITFRPLNTSEGIPQTRRPGVYIDVAEDVMYAGPGAQFPHSLCSNVNDPRSLAQLASARSFNKRQLMISAALGHRVEQLHFRCRTASSLYGDCRSQKDAMRRCERYLNRSGVDCLAPVHLTALEAFVLCLEIECVSTNTTAARQDMLRLTADITPACRALFTVK
ncbi:hypothetical protein ACOMHN_012060 [Nucella lapillus]